MYDHPADFSDCLLDLSAGTGGWDGVEKDEHGLFVPSSPCLPYAQTPPRRIWLDNRATRCALVDEADYDFFSRWRWLAKPDRHGRKWYAYRTVGGFRAGPKRSLFLHVEIQRRACGSPPSLLHSIVDHSNGDSLDCQRFNLRWATAKENRANTRYSWNRLKD